MSCCEQCVGRDAVKSVPPAALHLSWIKLRILNFGLVIWTYATGVLRNKQHRIHEARPIGRSQDKRSDVFKIDVE